jgi:hypothetical protein
MFLEIFAAIVLGGLTLYLLITRPMTVWWWFSRGVVAIICLAMSAIWVFFYGQSWLQHTIDGNARHRRPRRNSMAPMSRR